MSLYLFVNSGKALVDSKVTYITGAEGSMRFVDDSKSHKIASCRSMMPAEEKSSSAVSDGNVSELHDGQ